MSQYFLDFLKACIWFLAHAFGTHVVNLWLVLAISCRIFMMLYKVILTFDSEYEILWCEHSNETSFAVLEQKTFF